jgi:hypothetical protein
MRSRKENYDRHFARVIRETREIIKRKERK